MADEKDHEQEVLPSRKKQWLWFAGLWLGGLCAVLLLSALIKLLFKFA